MLTFSTLRQVAHVVRPSPTVKAPMRDANDVFILQAAAVGDADVICTWDADFYDPKTLAFCARLGIHVCDDRALLNRHERHACN